MSSKKPPESTDEREISLHYQAGATESPSSLIDQQILQQAKAALPESERSIQSVQHIRPKIWRKWQWSGSIAASVLLVSMLFVFNQSYYQGVNLIADEQYIESVIVTNKQIEEAKPMRRQLSKKLEQQAEGPGKNADEIVHDQTADYIQKRSNNKLLMSEQTSSFTTQKKDMPETEQVLEALALSASSSEKPAQEKRALAVDFLSKETDKLAFDYQRLDFLQQQLLSYQQKMNKDNSNLALGDQISSDQQGEHPKDKNAANWQETQRELYKILFEYKLHNPELLVPEKYLNVLSEAQLRELTMVSTVQKPR